MKGITTLRALPGSGAGSMSALDPEVGKAKERSIYGWSFGGVVRPFAPGTVVTLTFCGGETREYVIGKPYTSDADLLDTSEGGL